MGDESDSEKYMEEVQYHTRQKHVFLTEYLNIWSDRVKKSKPTLDIYDLFASFGKCKCDEKGEEWDGSALIAAKCLQKYRRGTKLWLNSYSDDSKEKELQHAALNKRLNALNLPDRIKIEIQGDPIEIAVDDALSDFNPNYPSFWILDPYGPTQLPWALVGKIAKSEGSFTTKGGKTKIRRPELFIVLMTSSLQRVATKSDGSEELISATLGIPTDMWKSQVKDLVEKHGFDYRKAIIYLYAHRLEEIYGKLPIGWTVKGTEGNIVYTIFLATDHRAGYYVMQKEGLPKFNEWFEEKWIPEAKKLKKIRRSEEHTSELQSH